MTAAIVSQRGKDLTATVQGLECPALEGNNESARLQAATRGQLWERVAEMGEAGVVNSPNYTPRIAQAYRNTKMHADGRHALGMSDRGPTLLDLKRRAEWAPAHYVHTGFEAGAL